MKLILRPIDTFTFRDHRDFQAGEDNQGYTFAFPTPSTIYGALRSAYIYNHSNFTDFANGKNEAVKQWMGTPTSYGKFSVLGTFIEHDGETYFPVPYDLQIVKEENDSEEKRTSYGIPLQLVKEEIKTSDGKTYRLFAKSDAKTSSSENLLIKKSDLIKFLNGTNDKVELKNLFDLIVSEDKIGIAVDAASRKTEDGKFYQIAMYTFKDCINTSFVTFMKEAPSFKNVSYARVGRKGRPWHIEATDEKLQIYNDQELNELKEKIKQTGVAKIVFLTPAILNGGTEPLTKNDAIIKPNDELELDVLTIATGRPDVIGGYDIVKNRPKPRKNALPAGTVVYVKVPEEKVDTFVSTGSINMLTDDLKPEGYGLYTIGVSELIEEE